MCVSEDPSAPSVRSVVVIGAGIVGLSIAWLLSRRGHAVQLIDGHDTLDGGEVADPALNRHRWSQGGSEAALGVLMAGMFHRSSGRAWRLRLRSQVLWQQWRRELAERGRPLPWRGGLLLLAACEAEAERQQQLLADPRRAPGSLQWLNREQLGQLWPPVPAGAHGGLLSSGDGQLDPLPAMQALLADARAAGLEVSRGWVEMLERSSRGWSVRLASGDGVEADRVVIAAGLGSEALIPLDRPRAATAMTPVLGQALELELAPQDQPVSNDQGWSQAVNWPGAVVWKGINLIHRQDPPMAPASAAAPAASPVGLARLWLGASLEPGEQAGADALQRLRQLEGDAPDWLLRAREIRRWQGLRARPAGQAAPLLQDLGSGLLLASGHYRNGVLLAPATAEWVLERIEAE